MSRRKGKYERELDLLVEKEKDRRHGLPLRASEWRDPQIREQFPTTLHVLLDQIADALDSVEQRGGERRSPVRVPLPVPDDENLLQIPKAMAESLSGCEAVLICAVRVGQAPESSLRYVTTPTFDNPGAWGVVLHDLVGHLANGYAHEGLDPVAVRTRILEVFDAERGSPTGQSTFAGRTES